jgi:hypothetical protein
MSQADPTPAEIEALIEGDAPIPCRMVEQWMESDDVDVLRAVYDLLGDEKAFRRIQPPFDFAEFPALLLRYMERCLRESPESGGAHNWAVTGMELVAYYWHLWDQRGVRDQEFPKLKQWLTRLYREGNDEVRYRIETAVLEHLLEDAKIAEYFSDWQHDSLLKQAYDAAMEWARDHPRKRRPRT